MHPDDPPIPKPHPTAGDSPAGPAQPGLRRGEVIEATIEKLVFGGDGLARSGAQVVFVARTAPGDRVRIRITEAGRGFARGEIAELLTPGPARRDPRCRHFGTCGGCQLQHVAYAAQLEAKAGFVRESLRRLGRIEWEADIPVRSGEEYGYRARAEFQARRGHLGYFRGATHEIVNVEECPILVPEAEAYLLSLRADPPRHAVQMAVGDDGSVTAERGTTVVRKIAGLDFEFEPDAFFQGNRFLADDLVRDVVGAAAGDVAVDLYAGSGLFSLPLARTFREVIAVEGHRTSARRGESNAARNGIANVKFAAESVEDWTTNASLRPDLVLLDPPRAGAGAKVARDIARLGAPAITYVSCDPATLARDLRVFLDSGYLLESLVALDLFPQTFHVETVAKLRAVTNAPEPGTGLTR